MGFDKAPSSEPKPDFAETTLLVMLGNFFKLFFKLPYVDRYLYSLHLYLSAGYEIFYSINLLVNILFLATVYCVMIIV